MKTQDTSLTFSTENQSLWKPGDAENLRLDTGEYMVFDSGYVSKNYSVGGSIAEFSTDIYYDVRFGLVAWLDIGEGGSWGATYELDLEVGIPGAMRVAVDPDVRSQMFFNFENYEIVSAAVKSKGFELGDTAESYKGKILQNQVSAGLDFVIDIEGGYRNAKLDTFLKNFDIGDWRAVDFARTVTLIEVNATVPDLSFDFFADSPEEDGPISLTLSLPQGADTEGASEGTGVVSSSGWADDEFLSLDADLDALLTKMLGKAGPQALAVAELLNKTVFATFEKEIGGVKGGVTVLNVYAHAGLAVTEDITLDIRDPDQIPTVPSEIPGLELNHPTEGVPNISVRLTSDNGTPDDESDDVSNVGRLGDRSVALFAPHVGSNYGTATVTAEYSIDSARFYHTVGVGLAMYLGLDILELSISYKSLSKSWGPLLQLQWPEEEDARIGDIPIFTDSFTVDGAVFGTQTDTYEVFFVEDRIAPPNWDESLPSAEAAVYGFFEAKNQQLAALFNTLDDALDGIYDPDFLHTRPVDFQNAGPTYDSTASGENLDLVHYLWGGASDVTVTLKNDGSRVTVATPTSKESDGSAASTDLAVNPYGRLEVQLDGQSFRIGVFESLFFKLDTLNRSSSSTSIEYTYNIHGTDDRTLTTSNVTNVLGGMGADVMVYHYLPGSGDTRGGEYFDGGDNVYLDATNQLLPNFLLGDLFIADLSHFSTPVIANLAQSVRFENDLDASTMGGIMIDKYEMTADGDIAFDADGNPIATDISENRIILQNIEALALRTGSGDDYLVGGTFADIFLTGAGDDVVRLVDRIDIGTNPLANAYVDVDNDLVDLGSGNDIAIVQMSSLPGAEQSQQFTDHIIGGTGVDHLFVEAGEQGLRYDVTLDGINYLFGGGGIHSMGTHAHFDLLLDAIEQTRSDRWAIGGFGEDQSAYGDTEQHMLLVNGEGNRGAIRFSRDIEQVSIIPDAPVDANGDPLPATQGAGDDLLVYMGGSRYDGGVGGTDTFLADFSTWSSYQALGRTGEGVSISLAQSASYFGATTIQNIDRLHVTGTFDFDVIIGGALDDYINGFDADDYLYGGQDMASDTLIGGLGNDVFTWAGDGEDVVVGGFGIDTLNIMHRGEQGDTGGVTLRLFDDQGAEVSSLTSSSTAGDTEQEVIAFFDAIGTATTTVASVGIGRSVEYTEVERVNVTGDIYSSDVMLYQGGSLYDAGNAANDADLFIADFRGQEAGIRFDVNYSRSIGGSDGYWLNNEIYLDGIDRAIIFGSDDFDVLNGGNLNDVFHGGAGNDVLYGGGGNDALFGGSGSDTFAYDNQGVDVYDGGTNAANTYVNGRLDQVDPERDQLFIMDSSGPLRAAIKDSNGDFIVTSRHGMALTTSSYDNLLEMAQNSLTAASWQYHTKLNSNLDSTTSPNLTYTNMEAVDISGSDDHDDLVVYQNGAGYVGGEGYRDADLFMADLRGFSSDLRFDTSYESGQAYDIGQGTHIADFERFFLLLGDGRDTLMGGEHDDVAFGGDGDDRLIGGLGNDRLYGEGGNDFFVHSGGSDTIDGGAGSGDTMLVAVADRGLSLSFYDATETLTGPQLSMAAGTPGTTDFAAAFALSWTEAELSHGGNSVRFQSIENIQISGSHENDVLLSGSNQGILFGGEGNDALISMRGDDFLSGGVGSDVYVFGADFGRDVIFGENFGSSRIMFTANTSQELSYSAIGSDLIITESLNSVRVIDYFATNTSFGLNFAFQTTDGLFTYDFSSLGATRSGSATIGQTYLGTDQIDSFEEGTDFRDTYRGFDADDAFYSSAGADLYDGGAGDDVVIYAESDEAVSIDLAAFQGIGGHAQGDLLVSIENVTGSDFNDTLLGDGFDNSFDGGLGDDSQSGEGGADILFGGEGNDTLLGGDGTDGIYGDEGDDVLEGGAHSDVLLGGEGNDILRGGAGADLLDDGEGDDSVDGGDGDDIFAYTGGLDVWDGGAGRDTANFSGFDAAVLLDLSTSNSAETRGGLTLDVSEGDLSTLVTMTGIESFRGSFYNDILIGNASSGLLDGNAGDDRLTGHQGDDTLVGGAGIDTLDYSLETGAMGVSVWMDDDLDQWADDSHGDRDTLISIENVVGTAHSDHITGNSADNALYGGLGDDYYLDGAGGADVLYGQGGDDLLLGGAGDDTLVGGDGDDSMEGEEGNDVFVGGGVGADIAEDSSGLGNDTFNGSIGIDTVSYATTIQGVAVDLTLSTGQVNGVEIDSDTLIDIENIIGGLGNDLMVGNAFDNAFWYYGGVDSYVGGAGDDTVSFLQFGSAVWVDLDNPNEVRTADLMHVETGPYRTIAQLSGIERIWGTSYNDRLSGDQFSNTMVGGAGHDVIDGGLSANPATDADKLYGEDGDDRFIGAEGDGADSIYGGDGTDTLDYSAATAGVDASLSIGNGDDSVENVERLVGSDFNDTLAGDAADNILQAGLGDDIVDGGIGDDLFVYTGGVDSVIGGDGLDTLDYTLFGSAIHLDLRLAGDAVFTTDTSDWDVGTERAITVLLNTDVENAIGSAHNDNLIGNDGANMFNGGLGVDVIQGLGGNDMFAHSGGLDTWDGGDGTDTANFSSFAFAVQVDMAAATGNASHRSGADLSGATRVEMVSFSNIENVVGSTFADELAGDSGDNAMSGLLGDDLLTGRQGADTLYGHEGDDTLQGGEGADHLDGGEGEDTASYAASSVAISVDLTAGNGLGGTAEGDIFVDIEALAGSAHNDLLAGNDDANVLAGNAGNDTLDGRSGTDILRGGLGNDHLIGGDGIDMAVFAINSTDITVEQGAGGMRLDSALGMDFVSDDIEVLQFDDGYFSFAQIVALAGPGNDTLIGTEDDDILQGGLGQDQIEGRAGNDQLYGGQGNDTILGEDGADRLDGGAGHDVLDGGSGRDLLVGGAGDDLYAVDRSDDVLVENAGEGDDSVVSETSYRLANHIENLTLVGSDDLEGEGNALANLLTGNAGNNRLNGRAGDDTISGGQGADTAVFGVSLASVAISIEAAGLRVTSSDGSDLISSDVEFVEFTDQTITRAQLMGLSSNAVLGTSASESLIGTSGPDILSGFSGNDTIMGRGSADVLLGGGGHDELYGESGSDTLDGGAGNDTLDGGSGFDTFLGGLGNDTYIVEGTSEQIVERAGEGFDLVQASNDYTLGDHIEALTLTGSGDLEGGGNEGANTLLGNGGSNMLRGLDGDDTLDGGAGGADTLEGGAGTDTAIFASTLAASTIDFDTPGVVFVTDANGTKQLEGIELLRFTDQTIAVDDLRDDLIRPQNVQLGTGGYYEGGYAVDNSPEMGDELFLLSGPSPQGRDDGNSHHFGVEYLNGEGHAEYRGSGFDNQGAGDQGTANSFTLDPTGGNTNRIWLQSFSLPLEDMLNADWDYFQTHVFSGDDTLTGSYVSDNLFGYDGDDRILGGQGDKLNYDVTGQRPSNNSILRNPGDAFTNPDWFTDDGDDTIDGGAGNDSLDGGTSNDLLIGGTGNDALWGGADEGNDTLRGGIGDDTLHGGDGEDIAIIDSILADASFVTGSGTVQVTSGDGVDVIHSDVEELHFLDGILSYAEAAVRGTISASATTTADTLIGTPQDETISGLAGNDRIEARAGDDLLIGGEGNDTLLGEAGNDTVQGGGGRDALFGGDGDDVLEGHEGNDTLEGGDGFDWALFDVNFSDVTVSYDDGLVLTSALGVDVVRHVESFGFRDQTIDGVTLFLSVLDAEAPNTAPTNTLPAQLDSVEGLINLDLGQYFEDADLDALIFAVDGLPAGVTLDTSTGVLSGALRATGVLVPLTVRARDPFGAETQAVVNWNIENVNDAPVGDLLITGTVAQGQTLTADATGITDADGLSAFAYQWLRDGVAVSGETGQTYQLTQADVGDAMSVRIRYTDGFGALETVTSDATAAVANENDAPVGAPEISGTGQVGETLVADTSGISDADGLGTFALRWQRDGSDINGATGESYVVTGEDAGARLRVVVTYTDLGGTSENVVSQPTGLVPTPNLSLIGTAGADVLNGGVGNDTISGLDGNDVLRGNAGDDSLLGGDGVDTLVGGDGNDILIGGTTTDDLRDVIYAGAGNDNLNGGYGNDELRGDAGNDTIAGGFGADTVIGGTGNDTLTGSAYADQIFGSAGDDFVNGGFGHDLLNGGAGGDRFYHIGIFDHGSDWVQDYNAADGDILHFGNGSALRSQFQVNTTHTATAAGERSGDDDVEEAFVIYRPTGQIMWALVDGGGQSSINLQIGGNVFDLML
ncbi:putative Ig domain-containing protein [Shimia thalassica]|uniref:putative Ig domain-containing protein n=1 Tax=Shimia thalassica TaxID=1715693 RepID=UPI002734F466|nr:putative Ig domain-containing protein [Shimia thalassica]MDP2578781.1 putative Ig domain-containing protein [Shimia thalassica]